MWKQITALFLLLPTLVYGQLGGIRGTIYDADFEVPLSGVKVMVSETGEELLSQSGGSFFIDGLPAGAYTLIFSANGYTRTSRSGIVVTPAGLAELDVQLAGEYEEMDELVVRDIQLGGSSEIGLLNLRMESSALMDSVGADLISRAGASDAAGALKLVAGTTVQDGKYAVVRGLPDRYVVSLLNGVRLPTSDPDKRAVQLDQFPSSLIESVRVLKSFSPDQQGDASGGAVDIVLRGVPKERVLKVSAGTSYNSSDAENEFLSYATSENNFLGTRSFSPPDDLFESNEIDPLPQTIPGSYGVKRTNQPMNYNWGIEWGDRAEWNIFNQPVSVGFVSTFNHEEKYTHTDDLSSYRYFLGSRAQEYLGVTNRLVPYHKGNLGNDDLVTTAMWDITKSGHEINWSGAFGAGLEHELLSLNYLHIFTHNAEDLAVLSEDTQGQEFYDSPPFRRTETLIFKERDTQSDQLSGKITFPVAPLGSDAWFRLVNPVLDWKFSQNESSLVQPDKRILSHTWSEGAPVSEADPSYDWEVGFNEDDPTEWFNPSAAWLQPFTNSLGEVLQPSALGSEWEEEYEWLEGFSSYPLPEYGWYNKELNASGDRPGVIVSNAPAVYSGLEEGDQLGNVQLIWERVIEVSDQAAFNYTWDIENWTGSDGFIKLGLFNDEVDRTFFQQTLSNNDNSPLTASPPYFFGEWEDNIAELYPENNRSVTGNTNELANTTMFATLSDIGYEGVQEIDAWYWMGELPLFDFLTIKGGARYEEFKLQTFLQPDDEDYGRSLAPNRAPAALTPDGSGFEEDADYHRKDVLPSIGLDLNPFEKVMLRLNYAETVAKQQFKELVPIRQREYAGAPVFAGNPDLKASPVENLDIRLDYTPYAGGLVSVSHFQKEITDPIEYFLGIDSINYVTFATNYPSASVEGWEMEIRQDLGRYTRALSGMGIGGNITLIEGDLDVGDGSSRDVMEMPEYLYNLFWTFDATWRDLKLGIFYTYQGDTLKTNKPEIGSIPAVYALGHGTLNFSLSMRLAEQLKLSFKAKNILDPKVQTVFRRTDEEFDFPDEVYTSYTKGTSYSLGLNYTF